MKLPASPELPDNALRFRGQPGHVESYFLRANHPTRPLALWLKATILAPLHGPAVAESWFIWFDGEQTPRSRTSRPRPSHARLVHRRRSRRAVRSGAPARTSSSRAPAPRRARAPARRAPRASTSRWKQDASPIAQPLSSCPWRFFRTGPFPKSKLNTPFPSLRFSGTVELPWGTADARATGRACRATTGARSTPSSTRGASASSPPTTRWSRASPRACASPGR